MIGRLFAVSIAVGAVAGAAEPGGCRPIVLIEGFQPEAVAIRDIDHDEESDVVS